ncbi:MAG TPA: GFA family protein [Ramlibacter sp.]|nr:GFA family protein [Ramlibacter sp.]
MSTLIEGGCFCKAVRYRLARAPSASVVCHCQSCRRAAAAPVVAWVTVNRTDFAFTQGEPGRFKSSAGVERTICAACGTPLTYVNEREPGTIDITTCSLDDPAAFPPTHHSWLSHDLDWVRFGDGLPTFPQTRPSS